MNPIRALVQSLGNPGAVANARQAVESRAQDDWVVEGLALRLASSELDLAARSPRVWSPAA